MPWLFRLQQSRTPSELSQESKKKIEALFSFVGRMHWAMLKLSEYIPTGIFLKCKWKGKFTKETSMKRNKYKNYDEKRKLKDHEWKTTFYKDGNKEIRQLKFCLYRWNYNFWFHITLISNHIYHAYIFLNVQPLK